MPKPDLSDVSPRDVAQIRNGLKHYYGWLVRQRDESTRRREYAFKYGNAKSEAEYKHAADVYNLTIARVEKLYELFQPPTGEEFAFDEWE